MMSEVEETLEWISPYLRLFLKNLVKSDIKQVAFGQHKLSNRDPVFPLFSWKSELMLITCFDHGG